MTNNIVINLIKIVEYFMLHAHIDNKTVLTRTFKGVVINSILEGVIL